MSNKVKRGKDAALVLESGVVKEAFEELEKFYSHRWRVSPMGDKGWEIRDEAFTMLKALDSLKDQLTSFVIDGTIAETKLNRREE